MRTSGQRKPYSIFFTTNVDPGPIGDLESLAPQVRDVLLYVASLRRLFHHKAHGPPPIACTTLVGGGHLQEFLLQFCRRSIEIHPQRGKDAAHLSCRKFNGDRQVLSADAVPDEVRVNTKRCFASVDGTVLDTALMFAYGPALHTDCVKNALVVFIGCERIGDFSVRGGSGVKKAKICAGQRKHLFFFWFEERLFFPVHARGVGVLFATSFFCLKTKTDPLHGINSRCNIRHRTGHCESEQ